MRARKAVAVRAVSATATSAGASPGVAVARVAGAEEMSNLPSVQVRAVPEAQTAQAIADLVVGAGAGAEAQAKP